MCKRPPFKASPPLFLALFTTSFSQSTLRPLLSPSINRLPCGFVVYHDSFLLLLNYNTYGTKHGENLADAQLEASALLTGIHGTERHCACYQRRKVSFSITQLWTPTCKAVQSWHKFYGSNKCIWLNLKPAPYMEPMPDSSKMTESLRQYRS